MNRREFVTAAAGTVACVSGCLGIGGGGTDGDDNAGSDANEDGKAVVEAGPSENEFGFVPEEVTVEAGETVEWLARSPRHNVVCDPEETPESELPEGAEPFKSYDDGDNENRPIPPGESYKHTFETKGEYVYVCIPHLRQEMVGRVTVI